ncbi:two-component system response regulator [Paenisporosarcina antarctica]|uniref:EAL domain-containing protein n=1 Tax=Paenisporosarcina antarctica TaxID=417367 RepID=A0A4P7A2H9_9BACL|nr:EAL domain-containing protein [Paenisporosarcina antarctica]QBP42639.1 EAL domain-containing protein [Paenisporosarcina antarctica]
MQRNNEKVNVLLVDDLPENLLALEAVLGDMNYNLIRAYSGEESLKCLLKNEFAVILLDVQMPGLNGFETAQIIKSRKKTKDNPIIFKTVISMPENVDTGYFVGAIDYIFKPDVLNSKIEGFSFINQNNKGLEAQTALVLEKTHDLEKSNQELSDITLQLRRTEALAKIVRDTSMDTIITYNETFDILTVNPAVKRMFGYEESELIGEKLRKLIPDLLLAEEFGHEVDKRFEVTGLRNDESIFPAEIQLGMVHLEDHVIYACTVRDISELKQQREALEHQALHDSLTSLPNRILLYDRLEQGILLAKNERNPLSLILIDLDHFKTINDTLGHHYGDLMLKEVGSRLSDLVRVTDTVARLGGDEFVVFLPMTSQEQTLEMANKIISAIEQPFILNNHILSIRLSQGIVFFPDHGENVETLMKRADIAMYTAKRTDREYSIFSTDLDTHTIEQLSLLSDLRDTLVHDKLILYYQPQMDMKTKKVVGVEVLSRWIHPLQGYIPPDIFIPMAEQNGLMKKLTLWVLEKALHQSKKWCEEGLNLHISVNLSASDLQDFHLPDNVQRILYKYNIDPKTLTLEITESLIMSDPVRAMETLKHLSSMGIKLSIDDFGTGYSSLAYLKNLSVDEIKVDKSFVMDMTEDKNNEIIVRTIINLAHNLGLRVVAEGIEQKGVWNKLVDLECDIAQGYFLCAPASAESFYNWYIERELF